MTDKQSSTVVVSDVIAKLRMAQCSSCSCLTKTNDPAWHKEECLYRVLSEAITLLAAPVEQQGEPEYLLVKFPRVTDGGEVLEWFHEMMMRSDLMKNQAQPYEITGALYRHAQPPAKVVLPEPEAFERAVIAQYGFGPPQLCLLSGPDLRRIWNACLDEVAKLNGVGP